MKLTWLNTYGFITVCLGFFFLVPGIGHSETYIYDKLNRIVKVDYGSGSFISYAYDQEGNITACTAQATVALNDAVNILSVQTRKESPQGVSLKADIDNDKKIGSTEAIDILQQLSK